MLSDGRLFPEGLAKASCAGCGLVRHQRLLQELEIKRIYDGDYKLAALPLDDEFLSRRQRLYADWIFSFFPREERLSAFDIGAGNASLLAQLAKGGAVWRLRGIDPVDAAAALGRAAGYDVETAFLDEYDMSSLEADLIISINVIEHVADPVAFLRRAASGIKSGGRLFIACPDGDRPSTELLIYDHIHSITYAAMRHIAARAGLRILSHTPAPAVIGPFHSFVLAAEEGGDCPGSFDAQMLAEARAEFLESWKHLDGTLEPRLRGGDGVFAFGFGENAQLLRTYAPRAWSHVQGIYADVDGEFDGKPVRRYSAPPEARSRKLLLAVRPDLQKTLRDRLVRDGNLVVSWDDLISGDG
ncbi:class I SAM-dependent methyltransferase [Microvirga lenta]|uniref:class I SAM-dependent methyltransferase n=1 Tax=Microvirga lenta TaxID=2881337 RepID=UPI001CFF7073|nr:class I SAM-dependent methyltransferase [Microvirga lenta]MCB5175189.1 class I SAM-dependent methyltransferase [Microvirga lenta]